MSALPAPSVALDQLALAALRWPRCALPTDGAAAEPPADDAVLHAHPNLNPDLTHILIPIPILILILIPILILTPTLTLTLTLTRCCTCKT
eukprot:scaffold101683_cov63-Phaeocystis_antarctica.AAC.7